MLYAATAAGSMTVLDMLVVSVALPTLQADLLLTRIEQQWVINSYLLLTAMLLPFAGRLADMFDRERLFLIGVVTFFAGSLASGLAVDGISLLVARGVQGVGAAILTPVSLALLVNSYPKEQRGRAVGIYLGIMMLFATTAPLIGGGLAELDWRLIFAINLPMAVFAFVAVRIARPDSRIER
jgi:MFS family permease